MVDFRGAIHTVTIESLDPERLARFWMELLGYVVQPNHTASVQIADPAGVGAVLLFAASDRPKTQRNRLHFDIRPRDRDAFVAHALGLGASTGSETEAWTRLRDPEGNEFCVLQSEDDFRRYVDEHGPGTPSLQA